MKKIALIIFSIIFILIGNAHAQWPALPAPNVPVTNQAGTVDTKEYWATSDGVGGSFVVWEDDRSSNAGIYSQRMQSMGVVKFVANGIKISDVAGSKQKRPHVAEGSNSTALIVWEDERNLAGTSDDIYAKSIDSSGATLWGGADGLLVCDAVDKQEKPLIVSDGSGGAIIAWVDKRSGTEDIYAQRINSAGVRQWIPANGVVISSAVDKQKNIQMIADGSGGAIITWEDERNRTVNIGAGTLKKDIYAQKIDATGIVQWLANGVVISDRENDQKAPQIATDGAGGGIFTWEDKRNAGTEDVYAQRITSVGVMAAGSWVADGVEISIATNKQKRPVIVSDLVGGAIIAWEDNRSGGTEDIYAHRVSSTGVTYTSGSWVANGVVVSNAANKQKRPSMTTANSGKALIVWEDNRGGGNEDVYVELIATDGTMAGGTANGIQVTNNIETQRRPFVFDNNNAEWIVLWEEDRNDPGGNNDVFAQGLNPSIIAALPVELISFEAHASDDHVAVKWITNTEVNNDYFTIEKSEDGINFEPIMIVNGAGNSNTIIEYFEMDMNPYKGISYYRLKQTNFDNKFTYSGIVPVAFNLNKDQGSGLSIFPNPSAGGELSLLIEGAQGREILVVLRNIAGNEVYSKISVTKKDNEIIALDLEDKLNPGIYHVTASSENVLYSKKLVVK